MKPQSTKTYLIGRAEEADIVVADESVSSRHAYLHVSANGRVEIEDIGSTNGTTVRGQRIAVDVRVQVEMGERVVLGREPVKLNINPDGTVHIERNAPVEASLNTLPTGQRRYLVTAPADDPAAPKRLPTSTLFTTARVANRDFSFHLKSAEDRRAYALHPFVPTRYLPVDRFHAILFEEKHAELLRILAALGASRTRSKGISGMAQRGHTAIGSLGVGAVAGAVHRQKLNDFEFEERYPAPPKSYLPRDLIWYPSEPGWREVARRRLDYSNTTFNVQLRYEEDWGVDAQLASTLSSWDRMLNLDFVRCEGSVVEIEGDFMVK